MAQTVWEQVNGEWVKVLTDGSTIHAEEGTTSNGQRDKNHVHKLDPGYSVKQDGKNLGGSKETINAAVTTALGSIQQQNQSKS